MAGSQQLLLGGAPPIAIDPNFNYTTLLLPGNGTNGAQNNTFLDSSTNAFSITRNGNTTQGTFSPFSQTGWGLYQPTSQSDYVNFTTGAGTLFQFTGDYTIEGWVFLPSIGSDTSVWITSPDSVSYHALNIDATNYNLYLNSGGVTASIAHGLTLNSWNHVAMVRSGSTITMYTNGTSRGTTTNSSTNGYASPALARIGGGAAGTNPRYLSNFRIVKGTAVYTANFTPPSTPLTAISGTSLLTASSNRFNDVAAAGSSPTITGSPSIQDFSPFNPTAAWDAATNGGSGYFDGSGDYLSVARDNVFLPGANTDFTIEAWVYLTATPGATDAQILGFGEYGLNSDYVFAINSSRQLFFYFSSSNTVCANTTTLVPLNAWTYVAVSRSGTGSNNLKVFVNGNAASFSVNSTLVGTGGNNLTIGADANGDESNLTGYITNIRFINGTGYTSLTVPTSPLTAITNTQLLTNFTNAGIYDATSKNDLETVGNAQISTTQSKFGGSSMYFDGNGDYLKGSQPSILQDIAGGDFTIEFWVYFDSVAGDRALVSKYGNAAESAGDLGYVVQWVQSTNVLRLVLGKGSGSGDDLYTWSWTPSTGVWYHVAVTRSGTSGRAFIDGTQIGTTSTLITNDVVSPNSIQVGKTHTTAQYMNGYIDDLRITKGVARYTANFTAPTAAFPLL